MNKAQLFVAGFMLMLAAGFANASFTDQLARSYSFNNTLTSDVEGTTGSYWNTAASGGSYQPVSPVYESGAGNCLIGGCLSFNGTQGFNDSVVNFTNVTTGESGPFTISFWLKAAPNTIGYSVMGENLIEEMQESGFWGTYYIYGIYPVDAQHKVVQFYLMDAAGNGVTAGINSQPVPLNNQLIHVAAIYNGTHLSIYLNGTLDVIAGPVGGVVGGSKGKLLIGNEMSAGLGGTDGFNYNGTIDEVHFWNRALSSSEISNLYHNESIGQSIFYQPPIPTPTPVPMSRYQNIDPNYGLESSVQDSISGVGQFTALVVDKTASNGNSRLAALGILMVILGVVAI
jgi:hypothetical protein